MEFRIETNPDFVPPTYNAAFHGCIDSNEWIKKMPYRTLGSTDLILSLLSYGGSSLAKFYGDEFTSNEAIEAIQLSLQSGVNYIDTSPWYGDSETVLGQALKDVPRSSYFIGTKVGRNSTPGWENRFDFSRSAVLKNVENSLSLLGVNYVDIIQIHDLEFCLDPQIIVKETLPALESVVKAGKAKYIGITSYSLEAMKSAIEASPIKIETLLSYSRMNFNDTSLLDYLPFLQEQNVGVINAAPVSMGLFTSRGPPEWHPATADVKSASKLIADRIQSAEGVTIEDAALGFGLRPKNKEIATTLVSMPTKEILSKNLSVVTAQRTEKDDLIYNSIVKMFQETLTGPGHWEGKEVAEYKKAIRVIPC